METVERSVDGREQGKGGINQWSTQDFKESKTILYDTKTVDTCYYTRVKTYRMYNTKTDPNINYGL